MKNKLNRLTKKELEEKEAEIKKELEAVRKRKDYLERKREREERCFGFSL